MSHAVWEIHYFYKKCKLNIWTDVSWWRLFLQTMDEQSSRNMVLFDQTKRELFTISNGYKLWHRKLRNSWKVAQ